MRFLFVLTELPYPAHRNGVALINHEIIIRAPADAQIDLLVADVEDGEAEAAFRVASPRLGSITYVGLASARRFRIGNLLSGALIGRCLFESDGAVRYLNARGESYDAIYVAPLMSYVDPGRCTNTFMNAVDSFARLNDNAFQHTGRVIDWIKSQLYRCYERKTLARVALTSFVSSADVEYIGKRSYGLPLVCTPNGVDTEYFQPTSQGREPFSLLFTGNFSYAPNAEAALYFARKVLPLLIGQRPQSHFFVVGRNPPPQLAGMAGVSVTGFVDDIRDFYRRCTVFVCPLLSGAGIKNKVLEAMACGIPIVTTSLGIDGIGGVAPSEHYVAAETPHEFVRHILDLWDHPAKAQRIAGAARSVVTNRMTWSQVATNYYEHLAHVGEQSAHATL